MDTNKIVEWKIEDSLLSPSGKIMVYIDREKLGSERFDNDTTYITIRQRIRIKDLKTGQSRVMLVTNLESSDPKCQLLWFSQMSFSPDERYVYFECDTWEKCEALHRIDLATGKESFVVDVLGYRIISSRKHSGWILSWRYVHTEAGPGSYPCFVSPDGKKTKNISEEEYRSMEKKYKFMRVTLRPE